MESREITREKIDSIFEQADCQSYYYIALYQVAFPHWNDIEKVIGYPKVGKETHAYIFEKAVAFDKEHHPRAMAGGLWMNNGFSCDEGMEEWIVEPAPFEWKAGSEGKLKELLK